MSNEYILTMKYPAAWWGGLWREALPLGNGQMGAAVYGGVGTERVLLTHEDLWVLPKAAGLPDIAHMLSPETLALAQKATPTDELPNISENLTRVRELLAANRVREAEGIYRDALIAKGYRPALEVPYPLGDLCVRMPAGKGFIDYERSLALNRGEALVRWTDDDTRFVRRQFVSRADDCFVWEMKASQSGQIHAGISLEIHDVRDQQTFRPPVADLPIDVACRSDGDFIYYAARRPDGSDDFGAVARIICFDGSCSNAADGWTVSGASQVLVIIKVFPKGERAQRWATLKEQIERFPADYEVLRKAHEEVHRPLFDRVQVDLGASQEDRARPNEVLLLDAYQGKASLALLEKLWAFGRYLLIASAHTQGQPSPLIGLWCGEYRGFWAFNMVNENLQLQYWQAFSGNMPELLLPVFDYFESKMTDFRQNARCLYDCRGIYVPAPTTPASGLLKMVVPHIIYWTGAAGWVGQLYYQYYRYTGNRVFLKERALPWLREVALFYEDFFETGADGFYKSSPSNSPENPPHNQWDGRAMCPDGETAVNATMDFAIAREVLTQLIEGERIVGEPDCAQEHWASMLEKIPAYQKNEYGGIREWMDARFADNEHHRHLSHLYPLFPGLEVDERHPFYENFAEGLRRRARMNLGQLSNWTLPHEACAFARIGDATGAENCLNLLGRGFLLNNLYTVANDWRAMGIGNELAWSPVQLDANMGTAAAIQEMLLVSRPTALHLAPALPPSWRRGHAHGLLALAGLVVDIQWEDATLRARVRNTGGVSAHVRTYAGRRFCPEHNEAKTVSLSPQEEIELVFQGTP